MAKLLLPPEFDPSKKPDAFERWARLAELAASRFDSRRSYEWKITLGFWAVLLTSLNESWASPQMPWGWWVVLLTGFTYFWLGGVWVANRSDKSRYESYYERAELEAGIKIDERLPKYQLPGLAWLPPGLWAPIFQFMATFAIAVIVYCKSIGKDFDPSPSLAYSVIAICVFMLLSFAVGYTTGHCDFNLLKCSKATGRIPRA